VDCCIPVSAVALKSFERLKGLEVRRMVRMDLFIREYAGGFRSMKLGHGFDEATSMRCV
jgi:hypothetical protein